MYTTISGLPVGAKVFEVANWHEDVPIRALEDLARRRLVDRLGAGPQIVAYEQREESGGPGA